MEKKNAKENELKIVTTCELEKVVGGALSLATSSLRIRPDLRGMLAGGCDCCKWEAAIA